MQDPRTGQELGTGPRVGRMFPMDNLHLPPVAPVSVAAVAAAVSSYLLLHFGILVLVMDHLLEYNS